MTSQLGTSIIFDSDFESGNGVEFREEAPDRFSFETRLDTNSDDCQWFYFAVRGAAGRTLTLQLRNTGATNVPIHWDNARPVVSSDAGKSWRRVAGAADHDSERGVFSFEVCADSDEVLVASFTPYTFSFFQERLQSWRDRPDCGHRVLGQTIEGRPIDLISIASQLGKPLEQRVGCWITARLHAGEVTASWTLDGLIDFLLSNDPRAMRLRQAAIVEIVPFVNPDGAVAGNYRDNIEGVNLNRVWNAPDAQTSPEILAVTRAIAEWKAEGLPYHFFADLHSDSETLANYAFAPRDQERPPDYTDPASYIADTREFLNLVGANAPDFTADPHPDGDSEDQRFSRNFMMVTYSVISVIFEGTYSFPESGPGAGEYMTPERHAAIGRAIGIALHDFFSSRGLIA